jgi:hypothetical protein
MLESHVIRRIQVWSRKRRWDQTHILINTWLKDSEGHPEMPWANNLFYGTEQGYAGLDLVDKEYRFWFDWTSENYADTYGHWMRYYCGWGEVGILHINKESGLCMRVMKNPEWWLSPGNAKLITEVDRCLMMRLIPGSQSTWGLDLPRPGARCTIL